MSRIMALAALAALAALSAPAMAELIVDGGFEGLTSFPDNGGYVGTAQADTGWYTTWRTAWGVGNDNGPSAPGSKAGVSTSQGGALLLLQVVSVDPAETDYVFRLDHKERLGGSDLYAIVYGLNEGDLWEIWPGANQWAGTMLAGGSLPNPTGWATKSYSFTAGGFPYLMIVMQHDYQWWGEVGVAIDNVSLTPEPGSLALLTLGAAAATLRRRRHGR